MGAPEDAWSFIHRIDPDFAGTYYHFETRIGRYTQNGRKIGYDPEEMLLLRNWLFEHSFRRRKEHVSDELPEVIHSQQLVELTPEQRRLYIKIRDEMQLEMEDGETKNIGWARHQVMRLKQACFSPELYGGSKESGKITQIKQDVADLVASGHKAIVFSEWRTAARILQRELAQYNPAYVDGTIKGRDRQAEEQRFNHDPECKLYIGTIRANQEAITLNAATYVLFADEEWMSLANYQAENRSAGGGMRGLGVETAVNVIRYQGADTIEQGFGERLRRQQRTFNVTVERDGGINTKRQNIRRVMDLLRNA
jgi:SNF2 family DNA or RNA helicase